MHTTTTSVVKTLKRHFDPSIGMLKRLIEICPDSFWSHPEEAIPFWQYLYHTIQGIDYWFCTSHAELQETVFEPAIYSELDKPSHASLTREQVADYLDNVSKKCERIFQEFDDAMVLGQHRESDAVLTLCDVILMQIRHIQHHVGSLNTLLSRRGYETASWQGYGE